MVQIFSNSKCDMVLRHQELKRNHLIMVLGTFSFGWSRGQGIINYQNVGTSLMVQTR